MTSRHISRTLVIMLPFLFFLPQLALSDPATKPEPKNAPLSARAPAYRALNLSVALPASARMRSTDSFFAIDHCESGYTQLSRVSLTVSRGLSGRVHYNVTTRGVEAHVLANHDAKFLAALNPAQAWKYRQMRRAYGGGLDVPFLRFVGVDLSLPRVGRREMEAAARRAGNFALLSREARSVVDKMRDRDIAISGTLTALGVTNRPVTVFAFLRVAKVSRADGSKLMVLSDRQEDRIAASDSADISSGFMRKGPLWWNWKPKLCTPF